MKGATAANEYLVGILMRKTNQSGTKQAFYKALHEAGLEFAASTPKRK